MFPIYKKERQSFFYTPFASAIAALFLLLFALPMANLISDLGKEGSVSADTVPFSFTEMFYSVILYFIFLLPILTMRTFADERKNGTEVLLMTSPVSVAKIVIAKFLANVTVYLFMLAGTLAFPIITAMKGEVVMSQLICAYIGIFCWTTAQYGYVIKRTDGTDATAWSDFNRQTRRWRPSNFRGNTDPLGAVPTYASADAAIASGRWMALELINAKTGMNFDVPTLLMHEIACRAGTTTTYFWGNASNQASQYAVYGISTSARPTSSAYTDPPGTKKPNNWGLYDMVGNDWQWCRNYVNEGEPVDVFTPGAGSSANWYVRGQNLFAKANQVTCDALSSSSVSGVGYGLRIAYVVPNAGE